MNKIFYSPILRTFLEKLSENNIASELLNLESSCVDSNINCIDLDDEGFVSFTQSDKMFKILKDSGNRSLDDYDNLDHFWHQDMSGSGYGMWTKSRNQLKIGRFVNQLLTDRFSTKEVEDFVNLFKSKQNITDEFELVKGEKISYWYNEFTYYSTCGDLASSCMRYDTCQKYFDIYTKNPKCQLLILKRDNYLIGRAIVWEVNYKHEDFNVEFMMDRVYTNKPSDILKFHEYAKEKGWMRKYKNTYSDENSVVYKDIIYNVKIDFQLIPKEYDYYPYVDTFKFYNKSTGILQNYVPEEKGFYKLEQTGGRYIEWKLRKFSNYYSTHIIESDAIWSELFQDWFYANDVVNINIGSSEYFGLYPADHSDVGYDPCLQQYIHRNDSIRSRYTGDYFIKGTAFKAYLFNKRYEIIDTDFVNPNYNKKVFRINEFADELFNIKKTELNLDPKIEYGLVLKYH